MSKFSVVIGTWSGTNKEYLAETVDSIREQGIEPRIVCDERDPGEKWAEAIADCETEYLHLAHADDVYLPGFYEKTIAYLDAYPDVSAVFTCDYIIDGKGKRIGQTVLPFPLQDSYDYAFVLNNMAKFGNFLRCPSVVMRVEKVRGLSYLTTCGTAGDTAMWFNLLERGPIRIVPRPLYKYRQHPGSDTQKNVVGKGGPSDHLLAMEYALNRHPELATWETMVSLSKAIKENRDRMKGDRLKYRADHAESVTFIVVHEPPDNAGTGILAAEKCRYLNRYEEVEQITYYVYPVAEADKISVGYDKGCPVIVCPTHSFRQAVDKLKPEIIEFHHLLRWPLDILTSPAQRKELFLHDAFLWCARYHMMYKGTEVCDGPNPAKCYHCAGITPAQMDEKAAGLAKLLPMIDAIYANSEYTAGLARKYLPQGPTIEVKEFPVPELTPFPRRKRIGYFGYFNPTKGIHILLEAIRQVDAQLLLFCDVPKDIVEGRSIYGMDNCLVMGAYNRRDLPKLCNVIDLAVCPSLNESWGITFRELVACGIPVIASKTGGQTGTVEPNSVQSLVTALEELL